jgi:hypothetical protein
MVEAKAKQVVVFLDYDGTLSPIVEDPDQAYMPNDVSCPISMYSQTNAVPFSQVYGCSIFGSSISLRCQAWDHIVVTTVHW